MVKSFIAKCLTSKFYKMNITQKKSELNYEKAKIENLINRFGGRELLLYAPAVGVQTPEFFEHIAPRNLECDFLKSPQETQS